MPTYDYVCTKCGHTFELLQQMTDPHIKKCPKCSAKVKRLIGSGSGIIFKGSGFYETDYKKKTAPEPKAGSKPPACPNAGPGGCSGCNPK
jgi:putative FmdB family regulatory protein